MLLSSFYMVLLLHPALDSESYWWSETKRCPFLPEASFGEMLPGALARGSGMGLRHCWPLPSSSPVPCAPGGLNYRGCTWVCGVGGSGCVPQGGSRRESPEQSPCKSKNRSCSLEPHLGNKISTLKAAGRCGTWDLEEARLRLPGTGVSLRFTSGCIKPASLEEPQEDRLAVGLGGFMKSCMAHHWPPAEGNPEPQSWELLVVASPLGLCSARPACRGVWGGRSQGPAGHQARVHVGLNIAQGGLW